MLAVDNLAGAVGIRFLVGIIGRQNNGLGDGVKPGANRISHLFRSEWRRHCHTGIR